MYVSKNMDAFSFLSFSLLLLLKMREPPFRLATSFFLCLILLLITPFLVVHIYFLFFFLPFLPPLPVPSVGHFLFIFVFFPNGGGNCFKVAYVRVDCMSYEGRINNKEEAASTPQCATTFLSFFFFRRVSHFLLF